MEAVFRGDHQKREEPGESILSPAAPPRTTFTEQIHRDKSISQPGTQSLYSDLGFMVLAETVEIRHRSIRLDRFCQDRIFKPIGMRSTGFVDLCHLRTRRLEPVTEMIAPTEICPGAKKFSVAKCTMITPMPWAACPATPVCSPRRATFILFLSVWIAAAAVTMFLAAAIG